MAKSKQTFQKSEKEKLRKKKRAQKQEKKEERKTNSNKGKGFESMIAYVDDTGMIVNEKPEKKETPLRRRS